MKDINKNIENFLQLNNNKKNWRLDSSERSYLSLYDKCDDFNITDKLKEVVWEFLQKEFPSTQTQTKDVGGVSVFHTNTGAGKIFGTVHKNLFIKAFNNDYICKRISDLVHQGNTENYLWESELFDISHYFINGDNGHTKPYSIVFTQLTTSDYYKGIDTTNIAELPPMQYYPVRSLDFTKVGGFLCIIGNRSKFNKIKSIPEIIEKTEVAMEYKDPSSDNYSCLILKKK
jgi:hypothetical protein